MGTVVTGARPPSRVAYYVALAGVVSLLLLLCCYFVYFCVKKINELSEHESLFEAAPNKRGAAAAAPAPAPIAYPVLPVVRDSATAMVRLCKELPAGASGGAAGGGGAGGLGGGGSVHPARTSPAPLRAPLDAPPAAVSPTADKTLPSLPPSASQYCTPLAAR